MDHTTLTNVCLIAFQFHSISKKILHFIMYEKYYLI